MRSDALCLLPEISV